VKIKFKTLMVKPFHQ